MYTTLHLTEMKKRNATLDKSGFLEFGNLEILDFGAFKIWVFGKFRIQDLGDFGLLVESDSFGKLKNLTSLGILDLLNFRMF